MDFTIEQIALAVDDVDRAIESYTAGGFAAWTRDIVTIRTKVFDPRAGSMKEGIAVADLAFNYEVIPGKEFELINFLAGDNFHQRNNIKPPGMSHMGLHVDSIDSWLGTHVHASTLMSAETIAHTGGPAKTGVRYKYVILDTAKKLGFYLKLIERIPPVVA